MHWNQRILGRCEVGWRSSGALAYYYLVELRCPRTFKEAPSVGRRKDYSTDLEERFGYLREFAKIWKVVCQDLEGRSCFHPSSFAKNIPFPYKSTVSYGLGRPSLGAILFSKKGEAVEHYDKIHLVPFGEYIPLRQPFVFLERLAPIEDFKAGENYSLFELSAVGHQPSPAFIRRMFGGFIRSTLWTRTPTQKRLAPKPASGS
jgi:hypothetical protein